MPSRTASLSLLKKCEHVAPGQIGICRKSMLTRETLQRPVTGHAMTRGRPKMPKDFIYGMRNPYCPNEIVQCLTWPKEKSQNALDPNCLPRDFHRINVESTKEGIHPVPEWLQFAKEKNYRLDPTKRALGRLRKPKFPKDMLFGDPHRPGTPIDCVLSHKYKTWWDEAALEFNKRRMTLLARSHNDIPQPFDTVASVLAMLPMGTNQKRPENAKDLWKMNRFLKEPGRLNTYWNAEESEKLLRKRK